MFLFCIALILLSHGFTYGKIHETNYKLAQDRSFQISTVTQEINNRSLLRAAIICSRDQTCTGIQKQEGNQYIMGKAALKNDQGDDMINEDIWLVESNGELESQSTEHYITVALKKLEYRLIWFCLGVGYFIYHSAIYIYTFQ